MFDALPPVRCCGVPGQEGRVRVVIFSRFQLRDLRVLEVPSTKVGAKRLGTRNAYPMRQAV